MAIPTVYRWDDGNAPVLSGTRGSMINLLEKCLVTGYGDKLPAGWTKEYDDTLGTKAVFRSSPITGNGFFLQVDEVVPTEARIANVQGYEIMTGVADGTGPFYATPLGYTKSNANDASSRAWVAIADEKFFHLFVFFPFATPPLTSGQGIVHLMFGDIIKLNDEGYNSLIGYYAAPGIDLVRYTINGGGNANFRSPRPLSGAAGAINLWYSNGGGPIAIVDLYYGYAYESGGPVFNNSQLYLCRNFLGDASSYTPRGFIPGLYLPAHDKSSFSQLQSVAFEGRTFLNIAIFSEYYSAFGKINVFVEIGAEWSL